MRIGSGVAIPSSMTPASSPVPTSQREAYVRAAVIQGREIAAEGKVAVDKCHLVSDQGVARQDILKPLAEQFGKAKDIATSVRTVNESVLAIGDLLTAIEREATRLAIARKRHTMLNDVLHAAEAAATVRRNVQRSKAQAAAAAAASQAPQIVQVADGAANTPSVPSVDQAAGEREGAAVDAEAAATESPKAEAEANATNETSSSVRDEVAHELLAANRDDATETAATDVEGGVESREQQGIASADAEQ
jgi:hypothetical protein